jgi:hypothetical protein
VNFLKQKGPADFTFEDSADIWVAIMVSVSHHDVLVKQKKSVYDFRLVTCMVTEVTKTWAYTEKIALSPLITNIVEPRGSFYAFIQHLKNLM